MKLNQYSLGIGDRFGRQGGAQLAALMHAQELGVPITPVWFIMNSIVELTKILTYE